jgi:hypothetical protein
MTVASACNKVFRKNFLQPDRIGIIPAGGYTDNRKLSKKASTWLLLEEKREARRSCTGGTLRRTDYPNCLIYV